MQLGHVAGGSLSGLRPAMRRGRATLSKADMMVQQQVEFLEHHPDAAAQDWVVRNWSAGMGDVLAEQVDQPLADGRAAR